MAWGKGSIPTGEFKVGRGGKLTNVKTGKVINPTGTPDSPFKAAKQAAAKRAAAEKRAAAKKAKEDKK